MKVDRARGFSLLELTLVLGIAALVIGAIVFTSKPVENTQKSRDTQRLGDLRNLHIAIQVARHTNPTGFFGATNTIYVSLPDTASDCSSWSLPTPPSGWRYRCTASTTLQQTDGSGWLPINFDTIKQVKLKQLPIDPINRTDPTTAGQGYYYTYRLIALNNHKLTSYLEFAQNRGPNSFSGTDGGTDVNLYEVFQDLAPPTTPTAPRNLSATGGNQQIQLTWAKPSLTGGLPITFYKIYRGLTSGNLTFLTAVKGHLLTYTDSGLTNGVTYYYRVSAINAVGESSQSNEVNAKPVGLPTAPQNLAATSTPNTITLNWSAPVSDGGSPISHYRLYRGTSSDRKLVLATTSNFTYTDTGLTNGATYYYQIAAVNAVGIGPRSNEASSTPQATTPSAPQNLRASPTTDNITLNWDPPASNGGATITAYTIYHGTSPGSATWLDTTSDLTYLHWGLDPGTTHYYQVSAMNSVGEGPRTDEIEVTTVSSTSSPPRNLSAKPDNRKVTLTWQTPASDGGASISNYRIYRATSPGAETFLTEVGNVLTYNDTGLTNGLTYYYQVTAVNINGESDRSNEASSTPAAVPSAPRNLNATAATSQISLDWQAPLDNGGSPITNYKIYRGLDDTNLPFLTQVGNVLTYTDTNLINGVRYYYRVNAVNAVGEGSKSNIANARPLGPPTAPRNLTAVGDNSKVYLNWQPPDSDGGAAINHYRIYRGLSSGGESYLTQIGNILTYTDTGLSTTTTYYYQVSAVNNFGEGPKSNEASVIPAAVWARGTSRLPSVPYSVVEAADGGFAVAGYTNPGSRSGSDAWVVKFSSNGTVEWQKAFGRSNRNEWAFSITTTSDNGYIVAGALDSNPYSSQGRTYYYQDMWVFKLDASGNIVWQKSYGGVNHDDVAMSVIKAGSDFVVSGWSLSLATFPDGSHKMAPLVLKLDNSGNIVWQKLYPGSQSGSYFSAISLTSDGGYIAVGGKSSNGQIVRLDSNGNIVWGKEVTEGGSSQLRSFTSVIQSADGDYLAVGWTSPGSQYRNQAWVVKFASTGDIQWQKLYGLPFSNVINIGEAANDVIQDNDGNFVVAGFYDKQLYSTLANRFWLFKLNSSGNLIWQKSYGRGEAHRVIKTSDNNYLAVGAFGAFGDFPPTWLVVKLAPDGKVSFNPYSGLQAVDTNASQQWTNLTPLNWNNDLTSFNTTITPASTLVNTKTTNETFEQLAP